MTDRIISVDDLFKALADRKPRTIYNPPVAIGYGQAMCDLEEIISELATPAPQPQESIFDADGWCWDIQLAPVGKIHCALKSREIHVFYKEKCGNLYKGGCLKPYKGLNNIIAWRLPLDVKFPTKGTEHEIRQ